MKTPKVYRELVAIVTILSFSAAFAFPAVPQERSAQPGTPMNVRLLTEIGSNVSVAGDIIESELVKSMISDGQVIFPAGTRVLGEVLEVQRAARGQTNGQISFVFDRIITDDGREYAIVANLEGASKYTKDSWKRRIVTVALALGAGVVLSKIFGGSVWRGVLLGGAAGTGYVLYKKGEDIVLPAGTTIDLVLEETVDVTYEFAEEPAEESVEEEEYVEGPAGFYASSIKVGPAATVMLRSGRSYQGLFSGVTEDGLINLRMEYGDVDIPIFDIKEIVFVAGEGGPSPSESTDTLYLKNGSVQEGEFRGFTDGKFVIAIDYGELMIPIHDVRSIVFIQR